MYYVQNRQLNVFLFFFFFLQGLSQQDKIIPLIFPSHFPLVSLISFQLFFNFLLILVFRVCNLPTQEGRKTLTMPSFLCLFVCLLVYLFVPFLYITDCISLIIVIHTKTHIFPTETYEPTFNSKFKW